MAVFDWMVNARTEANADPEFRALGSADATVCFQSGKHGRRVVFEAFEVQSVSEANVDVIKDDDILISMSTREWNSYLYRRRLGRAPTLLALDAEKHGVIKTKDIAARLQFERISRSIQSFVDYGALASGQ
ncbi:MAG: hypothetical protein J4G19_08825 [Pseudomonadales bacterium]|nr:hypothetical protein [Pseudomonadales bacterium]